MIGNLTLYLFGQCHTNTVSVCVLVVAPTGVRGRHGRGGAAAVHARAADGAATRALVRRHPPRRQAQQLPLRPRQQAVCVHAALPPHRNYWINFT